jgi:hypothetical protein
MNQKRDQHQDIKTHVDFTFGLCQCRRHFANTAVKHG